MTKRPAALFILSVAFLCFGLWFNSGAAWAQQKEPAKPSGKLGVLDFDTVEKNSKMGKDILRQTKTMQANFRDEIKKAEGELRKAGEELQRQRVLVAPEVFKDKEKAFEARRRELQKQVEVRARERTQIRRDAINELRKQTERAVIELAKKDGFTLILDRKAVILRATFLDVTPAIVQILDRNMPSYKFPAISKDAKPKDSKAGK